MSDTQIAWDIGTAYDLFVSLEVLYHPAEFDVRGVWAAGVRARIPAQSRLVLEQSLLLFHVPLSWIIHLPGLKDSNSVLSELRKLEPTGRLAALAFEPHFPPEYAHILKNVSELGRWDEEDHETLSTVYRQVSRQQEKKPPSYKDISLILDAWSHSAEFGERYLQALTVYCDVFFSLEERRIQPILQKSLSAAQKRAEVLPLQDLLEELTQGIRFEKMSASEHAVLAPSYWSTPLVYFSKSDAGRTIYLFGGRPADDPLMPGESVPDALLRVLKALSDSTRLQIIQYLSEHPHTPTELSRRLRLRVPTVLHHLKVLRLAGLVRLTLEETGLTRHYAARPEAVENAFSLLARFFDSEKTPR